LKKSTEVVGKEIDDFDWLVNDFVVQVSEANSKLSELRRIIGVLVQKGSGAMKKVFEDNEPWNYGEIERLVEEVSKKHEQLKDHIEKEFKTVCDKLDNMKNPAMSQMRLLIHGDNEQVGGFLARRDQQRENLMQAKSRVTKLERMIKYAETQHKLFEKSCEVDDVRLQQMQNLLVDLRSQNDTLKHVEASNLRKEAEDCLKKMKEIQDAKRDVPRTEDEALQELKLKAKQAAHMLSLQPPTGGGGKPPPVSFILCSDESVQMQKDNDDRRARKLFKNLGSRRTKQVGTGQLSLQDHVTYIPFHAEATTAILNKEWQFPD